ncbi:MAG: hypothetical protein NW226_26665 [Microscillaceae bacterium]|nr:hypothetical protein [Microscillaceae bacterium]
MSKYTIAYIDEFDQDTKQFQRYADQDFEIIPLLPTENIDDLIAQILESEVDAVIIDFDLTERNSNIQYKGDEVVRKILEIREDFPVFIFTSFDEQAIQQNDDVNMVYEKDVMSEPELNKKIKFKERVKKQIEHYKQKFEDRKKRLQELNEIKLTKTLTAYEEEELIELDDFIERYVSKKNKTPKKLKYREGSEQLSELIKNTEEILKAIKSQK